MKYFVGIVTFGNVEFTKLAVQSIKETTTKAIDICIVVGKPGDYDTVNFCVENSIPYIIHEENKGFPASINDLYDWGFKNQDYDAYIAMGNDVIAYPYAIDSLIEVAETTDYEWICSREYSVRALCNEHPEATQFFSGDDYIFSDFSSRPWDLAVGGINSEVQIDAAGLSDVHNLCLFKRSVYETLGYVDVNFYPAYYEDNDYARRAINLEIKSCTVFNSIYFHFWSRTIKQGSGGSTGKFFENNRMYYIEKWGGDFGNETISIPEGGLKIDNRENESSIIEYWRNK